MSSITTLPRPAVDLRPFKHTLPVGEPGSPTEIYPISRSPWFVPTSVIFRAHAGGVTTPKSSYPRSELREVKEWDSRSGVHQLRASLAVNHLPAVHPNVVVAQIHNGSDDVLQIRVEGRRLFVESDGDEIGDLNPNYGLRSAFYVRIAASKAGIRVAHDGKFVDLPGLAGSGWYFKAGCYLQTNTAKGDAANDYAEVLFDRLHVDHAA